MPLSTDHRQDESLGVTCGFKENFVGKAAQFHPADGVTTGIKLAGKSPRGDALQGSAKIRLVDFGEVRVDLREVFHGRAEIRRRRRVMYQLIARSHTPARLKVP